MHTSFWVHAKMRSPKRLTLQALASAVCAHLDTDERPSTVRGSPVNGPNYCMFRLFFCRCEPVGGSSDPQVHQQLPSECPSRSIEPELERRPVGRSHGPKIRGSHGSHRPRIPGSRVLDEQGDGHVTPSHVTPLMT